jgi:hypothetical protein
MRMLNACYATRNSALHMVSRLLPNVPVFSGKMEVFLFLNKYYGNLNLFYWSLIIEVD